ALDPTGPVGQMVLIGSMAYESCTVRGPGAQTFRQVIVDGERLLKTGLDAGLTAQIHFMVGNAYSDIVSISMGNIGGNGEYSVPETPREIQADRQKALAHYRQGLATDGNSENAKYAWRQAWRLSAGLSPVQSYTCGGD